MIECDRLKIGITIKRKESDMNLEGNVQLIEACLKTKHELTQRVIYNICDGSVTLIPHGALDYLPVIFVGGLVVCLTALSIKIVFQG